MGAIDILSKLDIILLIVVFYRKYGGYYVRWVAEAYVSATRPRSLMVLAAMQMGNGAAKHV